jgi:hypothetical protein
MVVLQTKLDKYLEASWRAGQSITYVNKDTALFEILPATLKDKVGYYPHALTKTLVPITLRDAMFGPTCQDHSIVLAGGSGVGKTAAMKTLLATQTVRAGKSFYTKVSKLDDYGMLARQGHTSESGAYGFDDCGLVSRNDQPLDVEDKKNLFVVRESSGYGARYETAKFMPLVSKIFACNFDWHARNQEEHTFAGELKWLKPLAQGNLEDFLHPGGVELSNHDWGAARKCIVFACHDQESLFSEDQQQAFAQSRKDVMDECNARYQLFLNNTSSA